jgi:transcriptional regulator GlxA family with amidase domain
MLKNVNPSPVHSLLEKAQLNDKQKLDELCQWLLAHLYEPIGWRVLAQRSNMTHEELHSLFIRNYQLSPMQWIALQRENLVNAMCSSKVVHIDTAHSLHKPSQPLLHKVSSQV